MPEARRLLHHAPLAKEVLQRDPRAPLLPIDLRLPPATEGAAAGPAPSLPGLPNTESLASLLLGDNAADARFCLITLNRFSIAARSAPVSPLPVAAAAPAAEAVRWLAAAAASTFRSCSVLAPARTSDMRGRFGVEVTAGGACIGDAATAESACDEEGRGSDGRPPPVTAAGSEAGGADATTDVLDIAERGVVLPICWAG